MNSAVGRADCRRTPASHGPPRLEQCRLVARRYRRRDQGAADLVILERLPALVDPSHAAVQVHPRHHAGCLGRAAEHVIARQAQVLLVRRLHQNLVVEKLLPAQALTGRQLLRLANPA